MAKLCTVAAGILEADNGWTAELGSDDWFNWLASATSFRYSPKSPNAPFTVRREGQYWYGYRKQLGKLHKRYLGKAEELTFDKLEQASGLLNTIPEKREKVVKEKPVTKGYVTQEQLQQLQAQVAELRSQLSAALGK